MADALKDFFDAAVIDEIAARIKTRHRGFDAKSFRHGLLASFPDLTLMQRGRAIADALRARLPPDYPQALDIILGSLPPPDDKWREGSGMAAFRHLPLLNFVGAHGLEHPQLSLAALARLTGYFSAEFDIRPYLEQHYDLTMDHVRRWVHEPDWHLRRLCSEGLRPRLPWGLRLKRFIADPAPVLEIVEHLRADPHDNVRRSVANNLNDIAKDHPALAVATAQRWQSEDPAGTRDAVRHGLRSLVKHDNRDALALMGFDFDIPATITGLTLGATRYQVGDTLSFGFELRNAGKAAATFSVDYAIHWRNARGGQQPKVFKLSKPRLEAGANLRLEKRHALKPISTRRYHAGAHKLEILVNGQSLGEAEFDLRL